MKFITEHGTRVLPGEEAKPRRTTTTTTNRYLGAMGCRVKGTSVGFYWFLIIVLSAGLPLSFSLARALEHTSGCLSLAKHRRGDEGLAGDAWIILAYLRRVDAMAPERSAWLQSEAPLLRCISVDG